MARYNEILVGRYNRFLQKFLGMKGTAPAPQLAGDIAATFTFFNGAENRYLEGWNRFGQSVTVAAGGAGTFTHVRLRNPGTSNVIAVLEKIFFSNPAAADTMVMQFGAVATDLATINAGVSRFDPRGNATGACIFSSQAVALTSFGGNKLNWQAPTNQVLDIIADTIQELPLLPVEGFRFREASPTKTIRQWLTGGVSVFLKKARELECES